MKQVVFAALFFAVFLSLPIAAQTNVALNKAVTVSTVQSGNIASNAVDGNTSTRWCASSGTVPQWLMVDLGAVYAISRTEVMWEKTAVYKYKVETSPDNSTWTLRVDRTANTLSQQTFVDNFTVTARYVRITATSLPSGVWASIFEFRVFGTSASTPPVITTQPANRTVTEGQSATFTIAATGNPTPTYQWRRNGTNLSGATSTTYMIATTAMTDSGAVFSCVTSNSAGSVTSNNAVLKVQRNLRRQDSLALVALYNSTGGPNWTNNTNWLTAQPIDTWYGVTMGSGRVIGLYLRYNNLSGSLVQEITSLTALQILDLSSNGLNGRIMSEIGNLKNLNSLLLDQNNLSDTIPASIGTLSNLISLLLEDNSFTGQIPASIGNLSNLEYLQLNDNQLSGQIPLSLGNLTKLFFLIADNNQLSGPLPSSLGNLTQLYWLSFQSNQLTGSVPPEIGNMSTLNMLFLYDNRLSGPIPSHIGKLTQLSQLLLGSNLFTSLPDSISYLSNVTSCDLSTNQFCALTPTAAAWASTHDPDWSSSQTCAKPEVQITASPLSGVPPLTVSFTATNIGSTMIETWSWTFGDGGSAAIQNPTHVYSSGGTYTARLIVMGIGNSGFDTASIIIGVDTPPSIITQPVSQTIQQGGTATFSVTATGTAPLSYQWHKNGILIPGATSSIYSRTNVQPADSGNYTVEVSNAAGSVTSAVARLTVTPSPQPPVITRDPESQTVTVGGSALFSVTATSAQPLSYAWRKNGVVVGGNTPTFGISQVSFDDSGSYKVIVTNAIGSDTSAAAILTVVPITIRSTSQQVSIRGRLYDTSGAPVGGLFTDTIETTVRLYDSLNGGAAQYTEFFRKADGHAINVNRGVFTIVLGQGTTTDTLWSVLARDSSLWVEITIDGSLPDVLLPRLPLTAAPYMLGNSTNTAALRTARMEKDGFNAP